MANATATLDAPAADEGGCGCASARSDRVTPVLALGVLAALCRRRRR
jgi:MYXO-CTERM domain-containing protein